MRAVYDENNSQPFCSIQKTIKTENLLQQRFDVHHFLQDVIAILPLSLDTTHLIDSTPFAETTSFLLL